MFGKNFALLQQIAKDHHDIATAETIPLKNILTIQNKHVLPSDVVESPLNTLIPLTENNKLKLYNSGTAQKVEEIANDYGEKALESLKNFPNSEAKTCLENLVRHFMLLQKK